MDDQTKLKISLAMKAKGSNPDSHRENISKGMKEYWKTVPSKPTSTGNLSSSSIPTSQSDKTLQNGVTTKTNPRNNDKIR